MNGCAFASSAFLFSRMTMTTCFTFTCAGNSGGVPTWARCVVVAQPAITMARRTNQRFMMRFTRGTFSFRAMTYQFEPRLAYARTLPSAYYFDAAVFDAENRNIFAKS